MDFELSEELAAVRDLAREFAEKEIAPTAAKDDKEHAFRKDLVKKMGELGFYGAVVPESYGGSGLGFLAMVLITEEIARVHSAMRVAINMQMGPALALLQFGTEEQKKKWIPPLVQGDVIGCFAITEPDAGSDVSAMRTTATKNGDSYTLNGNKIWISNAPVTDGGLVYAYTDRAQKHRGMTAFYADLTQPGVTRKPLETLGAHCSPIGELTFEHFRIPAVNRLGNEGDGFKICMWQLNQTRLKVDLPRPRSLARRPKETEQSRGVDGQVHRRRSRGLCGRRGVEDSRGLWLFHRISSRALLPGCQVLSNRRRRFEHPKNHHRPGRAGIQKSESIAYLVSVMNR